MKAHFHNLQALRGVACLLVVLYHVVGFESKFGLETPLLREVRWFGFAGVDLFFVLSGFLITTTTCRDLGRPAAVPGYLFRRAWRIFPAYWAAMAVATAFGGVVFGWPVGSPGWAAGWPRWLTLTPTAAPNPVIGQAWTLTYEVMFYAAFGLLLVLPPRAAAAALGGWAVVVAVAAARAGLPGAADTDQVVSPFVLEFLGGCAVAGLDARGVRRGGRVALVGGLVYAAAGVGLARGLVAMPYDLAMAHTHLRVLVFGPPAMLIVYGLVALEGRCRVPGWLRRVGDGSYSLYLLHTTVILAAAVAGMWFPHTRLTHTLWVAATFAAAVALGLLFHRWVERPLLNLAKPRRPVLKLYVPGPAEEAPVRKAA